MKRIILISMMAAMVVTLSLNAKADEYEYGVQINNISYNLNKSSRTATVTYNYNINYSGAINIPKSIVYNSINYLVTSIGDMAFRNCSSLISVNIPNSVVKIGFSAFEGCNGLTSMTIPNDVTSIGNNAFYGCCSLTSVTIPNNVVNIGDFAFANCWGLTSITIPKSVTSIGNKAFNACSGLTSIVVEYGNPVYDSRENCNAIIETSSSTLIRGCDNTIIPDGIRSICSAAFSSCRNLTSLIIPTSVTSIGEEAFINCSALISVTIPYGITCIPQNVFFGCSGLKSVIIPNSVKSISNYAFQNAGLTSIKIPDGITTIGSFAFCNCLNLASVIIPNDVTSIGQRAFSECRSLSSVISEIKEPFAFDSYAFFSIASNCTLTVPYGTKDAYIAAGWTEDVFKGGIVEAPNPNITFADANVKALCVANWDTDSDGELSEAEAAAVTDLSGVFKGKTNITSFDELQYFTGMTSISNGTFSGCSNLTSVIIPNGIKTIGDYAFFSCKSLKSLTFPTSITSIGNYAFEECRSLQTLVIPTSVTSIGVSAFGYCDGLTSIKVEEKNLIYDSRDNCNAIIQKEKNTLITGCLNTIIPTTVRSIGQCAFRGCNGLTSMSIPSNIQEIGGCAFQGCVNLESLVLPATISSIGGNAFWDCNNLVSVVSERVNPVVLNSMSSTFSISYDYPNSLRRVLTVPYGTKSAYIAAGWTESFFPGGIIEAAPVSPNITFADANVKAICVRNWDTNNDGELSEAEAAAVTSLNMVFTDNNTITSFNELQYFTGLTAIGDYAFYNCSGLATIIIPNSVTSIGYAAFDRCNCLTAITIPNSVISIDRCAFYLCSSLSSVTIPKSVTTIGDFVFQFCSSLTTISIEEGNTTYDSRNSCNAIIETASNTIIFGISNTVIPNNVTGIGEFAFEECSDLTSITIPSSVTNIERYAFSGCSALTNVISEIEDPFTFESGAFNNISTNCVLTVPYGTKDKYIAKGWTESIFKGGIVEAYNIAMDNYLSIEDVDVCKGQSIMLPVNMNNTESITALQFEVTLPAGISLSACHLTDRKGKDHTVSFKKLANGNYQVAVISTSSKAFGGKNGALVNLTLEVNNEMEAGGYPVTIKNIELTTTNAVAINPADVTAVLTVNNVKIGDANGDGRISITDAVAIVNYILGNPPTDFVVMAADVNGDGEVDVFDVTKIIGIILSGEDNEAKTRKVSGYQPIIAMEKLYLENSTNGMRIAVDNADRFTAFQMDVEVPDGTELKNTRLAMPETGHILRCAKTNENRYRIIALSLNNTPLSTTADGLLELGLSNSSDVQVSNILFVTPQGEEVQMESQSGNIATDIKDIETSTNTEIYDLSGQKLQTDPKHLPKGMYIINGKKVLVK